MTEEKEILKPGEEKETGKFKKSGKDFKRNRRFSPRGKKPSGEARFKGCKPNDYSWINYNTEMLDMAARFPFGRPLGYVETFEKNGADTYLRDAGIIAFDQLLTLGSTVDDHSPVNLAGIDMAAAIRKTNSGSYNWEYPDLLCLMGALGNALAFLGWMQRVVGRVNRVIDLNLFTATRLTYADRVDYSDLIENLPSLERFIQVFAARLNIFSFPKDIPYLANCYMAFRYDYVDINNKKVQYYIQRPAGFGIWNGFATPAGSGLYYFQGKFSGNNVYTTSYARTVQDIIDLGNAILDGLSNDQDVYVMMGDIRKAYSEGELYQVQIPTYPLTAPEAAVYSEEMLWQFHHLELVPSDYTVVAYPGLPRDITTPYGLDYLVDYGDSVIYYQYRQHIVGSNGGTLTLVEPGLYEVFGGANYNQDFTDHIFDTDVDTPSTEEIVNDARMKLDILEEDGFDSFTDAGGNTVYQPSFDATTYHELYITTKMEVFLFENTLHWSVLDTHMPQTSVTGSQQLAILYLTQFNKAPMVTMTNSVNNVGVFGSITNKTVVKTRDLDGLFRPILYSLFHCPQMK